MNNKTYTTIPITKLITYRMYEPSSVRVFQVELGEQRYILKAAKHYEDWSIRHLKNESKLLKISRDLQGITKLIKLYEYTAEYDIALLKEYFDGNMPEKRITDTKIQSELESTVRELHKINITALELDYRNIIINNEYSKAKIVDIGHGILHKYRDRQFKNNANNDMIDLENLFD